MPIDCFGLEYKGYTYKGWLFGHYNSNGGSAFIEADTLKKATQAYNLYILGRSARLDIKEALGDCMGPATLYSPVCVLSAEDVAFLNGLVAVIETDEPDMPNSINELPTDREINIRKRLIIERIKVTDKPKMMVNWRMPRFNNGLFGLLVILDCERA